MTTSGLMLMLLGIKVDLSVAAEETEAPKRVPADMVKDAVSIADLPSAWLLMGRNTVDVMRMLAPLVARLPIEVRSACALVKDKGRTSIASTVFISCSK
mmetsp:Transcript_8210/g.13302  ORF Transcript_8210/g.13302 Transcript_8210/m.13302 type:complete len:99 (-) Transcript_8210:3275-3571(-)